MLLDIHQLKQAELAALVVEKQINVRPLAGVVTRGRAEQVKVLNPELPEFGLVCL